MRTTLCDLGSFPWNHSDYQQSAFVIADSHFYAKAPVSNASVQYSGWVMSVRLEVTAGPFRGESMLLSH